MMKGWVAVKRKMAGSMVVFLETAATQIPSGGGDNALAVVRAVDDEPPDVAVYLQR